MLFLVAYVATIFLANWALVTFGFVPVGFGLMAPAGVCFAGLVLGTDPDRKVGYPHFPVYHTDRLGVDYRLLLVEDATLATVAARLIERHPAGLGALARITVAYCWSQDSGMVQVAEAVRRPATQLTLW